MRTVARRPRAAARPADRPRAALRVRRGPGLCTEQAFPPTRDADRLRYLGQLSIALCDRSHPELGTDEAEGHVRAVTRDDGLVLEDLFIGTRSTPNLGRRGPRLGLDLQGQFDPLLQGHGLECRDTISDMVARGEFHLGKRADPFPSESRTRPSRGPSPTDGFHHGRHACIAGRGKAPCTIKQDPDADPSTPPDAAALQSAFLHGDGTKRSRQRSSTKPPPPAR